MNPDIMGTKNPSFNFNLLRYACIASGIAYTTWNPEVGYLVVRGLSDYCDPHKNDGYVCGHCCRALYEGFD
jgi:hypothetical protein